MLLFISLFLLAVSCFGRSVCDCATTNADDLNANRKRCCRVRRWVPAAVLQDAPQEAVPLLLQQVLRGVPVRAAGHLRQQGHLPLLQRLEDQERRAQVPMKRVRMRSGPSRNNSFFSFWSFWTRISLFGPQPQKKKKKTHSILWSDLLKRKYIQ